MNIRQQVKEKFAQSIRDLPQMDGDAVLELLKEIRDLNTVLRRELFVELRAPLFAELACWRTKTGRSGPLKVAERVIVNDLIGMRFTEAGSVAMAWLAHAGDVEAARNYRYHVDDYLNSDYVAKISPSFLFRLLAVRKDRPDMPKCSLEKLPREHRAVMAETLIKAGQNSARSSVDRIVFDRSLRELFNGGYDEFRVFIRYWGHSSLESLVYKVGNMHKILYPDMRKMCQNSVRIWQDTVVGLGPMQLPVMITVYIARLALPGTFHMFLDDKDCGFSEIKCTRFAQGVRNGYTSVFAIRVAAENDDCEIMPTPPPVKKRRIPADSSE